MLRRRKEFQGRPTTPVYNATLERYRITIDSKGFVFEPNSFTDVPDDLINYNGQPGLLVRDYVNNGWGLMVCYADEDFDFEQEKRDTLIKYISEGGRLFRRLLNFQRAKEEAERRGEMYIEPPLYTQSKKWDEELRELLNAKRPILEEKSFKDLKVVVPENLMDGVSLKKPKTVDTKPVKARGPGRPPKAVSMKAV